jgi:hypothetical protein
LAKPRAASARQAYEEIKRLADSSLSPRERARVRGNASSDVFATQYHL